MLIRSIVSSNLDDVSSPEIKYSFYKMKVGTEVWNWWREDKACRIRQKIAPAPLLYFEEGRVNEKWRNENIAPFGITDAFGFADGQTFHRTFPLIFCLCVKVHLHAR